MPARFSLSARTRLAAFALAGAAGASGSLFVSGSVAASPTPDAVTNLSPHQVKAKVRALQGQVDRLVEQYDAARVSFDRAKERAASLARQLGEQQRRVDALRVRLSDFAANAYRNGNDGLLESLLGSDDPADFLQAAAALRAAARGQGNEYDAFVRAEHDLLVTKKQADALVARQRELADGIAQRKSRIEGSLVAQRALLSRLDATARASLIGSAGKNVPLSSIDATGRAAVAIKFAYAQLGKPYRWGAAGPGAYDCSGLTMAAWGAAGVSLPHSSAAQFSAGTHVPTSELRPGDLVFFGSPIHHVGLYIGGGNMIAAPHTGDVVKIQSIFSSSQLVGAVRVG